MSRLLSVVIERGRARFFDVGRVDTAELPCLVTTATRGGRFHSDRGDAPGRGEGGHQRRLQEERRRHATAIAARITAFGQPPSSLDIVLSGPAELVRQVRDLLPPALRRAVIGTVHLDPKRVTASRVQRESHRLQAMWTQLVPQ